jgi:lipoate---protein ligase
MFIGVTLGKRWIVCLNISSFFLILLFVAMPPCWDTIRGMLVVRSNSMNPCHNLAMEELCLDKVGPGGRILFLWQSSDTVVIGKNQNPWMECSLTAMEKGGAKLARRLSGGGAVFHDAGNLNFAFLMPRREYNKETVYFIVIQALHHFGVQAAVLGKSGLAVNGRKVSGNAFCYRRENVLHHGTLLISTNLDKMSRYLSSAHSYIHSRSIRSNPAPVANLRDMANSITIPQLAVVLAETAAAEWRQEVLWGEDKLLEPKVLDSTEKKYASWEWRFGMTPPFEVEMNWRFRWGEARVRLLVEKAFIRQSEVDLQGNYRRLAPIIGQILTGARFSENDILRCLRKQVPALRKNDATEFAQWLVGS